MKKLDVYQASKSDVGRTREVCGQLERASLPDLLNPAEGNGKRQRQVRAKFFDDARGSATGCAGCLDAPVAQNILGPDRIIAGKQMLAGIVPMPGGLVERFDSGKALPDENADIPLRPLFEPVEPVRYMKLRTRMRARTRTKI